jgi:hypothetical protein
VPVRGLKPVLKFRGRIRYVLTRELEFAESMIHFQNTHPAATMLSPAQVTALATFIVLLQSLLAEKVNV